MSSMTKALAWFLAGVAGAIFAATGIYWIGWAVTDRRVPVILGFLYGLAAFVLAVGAVGLFRVFAIRLPPSETDHRYMPRIFALGAVVGLVWIILVILTRA